MPSRHATIYGYKIPSPSVPGSPPNSVQFNNAGAFGGDGDLQWDSVNKILGLNQQIAATPIANQNSPSLTFQATGWNGAVSVPDTYTIKNTLFGGTDPSSILEFNHTGFGASGYGFNSLIYASGGIQSGGNITVPSAGFITWDLPNINGQQFIPQNARVTLTSAQILGMYASPVTILPALGAGKMYALLAAEFHYRYNTIPYTLGAASEIVLTYDTVDDYWAYLCATAGNIDQAYDTFSHAFMSVNTNQTAAFVEGPLVVTNDGSPLTLGDGTITINVSYYVLDTTLTT